jgi:hypothetical protein
MGRNEHLTFLGDKYEKEITFSYNDIEVLDEL